MRKSSGSLLEYKSECDRNFAVKLLKRAKESNDATDAWALVDYLWNTMILEKTDESVSLRDSEHSEFKSGDKVKALLPDTLDTYMDATFDHYATGQEVRDAGWENISDDDMNRFEFYVVTVDWKGKPCKMITNGIKRD